MDETTKYGHKYISPSCCTYGDYGGAGTVGVANVRAILEMDEFKNSILRLGYRDWENIDKWNDDFTPQHTIDEFKVHGPPKVVHLTGGWGSNTLWLLECEETKDIIACLADYPLLDDDLHGQVELEWEDEAWECWVRSDLYSHLDEDLQEAIDDDKTTDAKLYEAYRLAMESTNTYPTHEYAGTHVDIDRIKDEYNDNVRTILT
tara:strand:- start:9138 stop:9749 length:612 start_codon:yes stop_codon:yes gene_type:complete